MTSYPTRTGLIIGLPLSGNPLVPEFTFSFAQLHPPMNYNVEFSIMKGLPVAEARQRIAEFAISRGAKFLFFIDEDVTVPAHTVRQLIYHLEHFEDFAVAGGIYCHKSPPQMPMVFRGNGQGPYWDWKLGEVFECSGLGMGCTMIRTEVFSKMEKPWFKTIDSVDKWLEGIPQSELWTEDLYFLKKVEETGMKIMADGGLLCGHWDAKTGTEYKLPATSKPMRRPEWKEGTKKIIDLGCGRDADESYKTDEGRVLRVDIREEVKPDYRCDIRRLPFATGEFDVVFSSHTLEHFCKAETGEVLDEWIRIMKPDGELRLNLPNIQWAAKHIMNNEIDVDVMNVLYGGQTYQENFHKMGFTPQMVEQLLAERGFKKFIWDFNGYHMFVRAWKVAPKEEVKPGEVGPIIRIEALEDKLKREQQPTEVVPPVEETNASVNAILSKDTVRLVGLNEKLDYEEPMSTDEAVAAAHETDKKMHNMDEEFKKKFQEQFEEEVGPTKDDREGVNETYQS